MFIGAPKKRCCTDFLSCGDCGELSAVRLEKMFHDFFYDWEVNRLNVHQVGL
jgi:hypothetical protein